VCFAGWCWEASGSQIEVSGEGLVATQTKENHWQLATGGEPMMEGQHFWEVEVTKSKHLSIFLLGAVRPGLDHEKSHASSNDAYYIDGTNGSLFGNGNQYADEQGALAVGDRIGCLLDLDACWLHFYRNGVRFGPGFTEGVTGPLVRAVQLYSKGCVVTALPRAEAPEGAGREASRGQWPEAELEAEDY
jgi:hypothetical protein